MSSEISKLKKFVEDPTLPIKFRKACLKRINIILTKNKPSSHFVQYDFKTMDKQKIKALVKKELKKTPLARHPGATLGRAAQKYGKVPFGAKIGAAIGKIAGTGDYTISGSGMSGVPGFQPGRKNVARIQHREYVGDVVASSTAGQFLNTSYPINPGISTSFPWLSTIAQQYDQWRPVGMMVEFVSSSSSYSGTSALGIISIAADYDVLDATYTSKIEMNNSMFAVSGPCSENLRFAVECKPSLTSNKLYFTRGAAVPSTDNARFFDLCNLQVATYGATADQVCGELWITYDIEFQKPQIYGGNLGKGILNFGANLSGADATHLFGTTADVFGNGLITVSLNDITFSRVFAGCCFQIQMYYLGTSDTTTVPTVTYSSSCETGPLLWNSGSIFGTSGTDTQSVMIISVKCSAKTTADMTVSLSTPVIPTSLSAARLQILQVPPESFWDI